MKIILNRDIINLGEEGDVCDVAKGYARNYLFPRDLAVPYNKNSLRIFEAKRDAIEARKTEKRQEAQGIKERLEGEELTFSMTAGDSGKLFGSVTPASIGEELEKRGYNVERRRIEVPEGHIRFTGEYTVNVKLYGQEEAEIKVIVQQAAK